MSDEDKKKAEQQYQIDPSDENAQKLLNQMARSGNAGKVLYVIVATAYDYNDNYFYTIEGEPYHMLRAYVSEARAQEQCAEQNRKSVLNNEIQDWVGEGDDFFHSEIDELPAVDYLRQFGIEYDDGELANFNSALKEAVKDGRITDEVLDKIYEASCLSFYHVEILNVEDGLCGEV